MYTFFTHLVPINRTATGAVFKVALCYVVSLTQRLSGQISA